MQPNTFPAILLMLTSALPAYAQQPSTAHLTVGGRVGAATLIGPSQDNPLSVQGGASARLIQVDRSRITVQMAGGPAGGDSRVKARLLIRTNAAFELRATVSTASGPAIAASLGSLHPTGPGVVPAAASRIHITSSPLELSSEPALLASGPRISRGSASSPRNAVLIEILLDVGPHPSGAWTRDVTVTISPGGGA